MPDLTPRFLEIRVYNPTNNHLLRVIVVKYDFLRTPGSSLTSLQAKSWLDSERRRMSLTDRDVIPSLANHTIRLPRETVQRGLAIRLRFPRRTISSNHLAYNIARIVRHR